MSSMKSFRLGLFEHPYADAETAERVVHSAEHQQLALKTAREGIVLLKNDGAILPLKKDVASIAVIGPDANDGWSQLGDYSPHAVPQKLVTVLDGIRNAVGEGTRVDYVRGCYVIGDKGDFAPAIQAARTASVAVVVVGEHPDNDGRGHVPPTDGEAYDVASLDLTGHQEELVRAIQATGTPVVLLLINAGRFRFPGKPSMFPQSSKPGSRESVGVRPLPMCCSGSITRAAAWQLRFREAPVNFPTITTTNQGRSTGCRAHGAKTAAIPICPQHRFTHLDLD